MPDDLFFRALVAGAGLALVAGPLGCFVIWRRMAFFGDTMAHAALLGIALALLLDVNVMIGVFGVTVLVSLLLMALERRELLSTDAVMGMLSHATLALGLVILAVMRWAEDDLLGLLFGNILSVSAREIALIYGGGAVVIVLLLVQWRSLLAVTVSEELAEAEGLRPTRAKLVFMLLMAIVIAIAMKIVGILLITALLIIPAATARRFASTPEQMAVFAAMLGVGAVILGLIGADQAAVPSGPSIVVAALVLFIVSALAVRRNGRRVQKR